MIGNPMLGANRFFCGRIHRRPLWVALMDRLGWHQELYRNVGETTLRHRWVRSRGPGMSIYTCRAPIDHWRFTLKPQGKRWVNTMHVRDFNQAGLDEADQRGIINRKTPYWVSRIRPHEVSRKPERIQVPTEAWELGHKYEFTRWQELEA